MAENRVQFNLKNVHYAVLTETVSQGVVSESFGTPVPIPGAVSVALSADGGETVFYADGIKYFMTRQNNGYTGSIELAKIPDSMMKDVFGMELESTDKTLIENTNDTVKDFALLFQIDGDADQELYAFYKCRASRPAIESQTNTETREPKTQTLELSIAPLQSDGTIKARTTADTTSTVKSGWFTSVYTK